MNETRITRTVDLDATLDQVWRAMTEPRLLGDWLDSDVELEVCPGGEGIIVEPDGAVRRACVDEVEPARRLALRWWPEDGGGPESKVEFDLQQTPDGTRVVVTETLIVAAPGSATASAATADGRWAERFLLLGCCLLRVPVACR